MTGTPEGSTESGFMEKPGIETCDPWYSAYPLHQGGSSKTIEMMHTMGGEWSKYLLNSCNIAFPERGSEIITNSQMARA